MSYKQIKIVFGTWECDYQDSPKNCQNGSQIWKMLLLSLHFFWNSTSTFFWTNWMSKQSKNSFGKNIKNVLQNPEKAHTPSLNDSTNLLTQSKLDSLSCHYDLLVEKIIPTFFFCIQEFMATKIWNFRHGLLSIQNLRGSVYDVMNTTTSNMNFMKVMNLEN